MGKHIALNLTKSGSEIIVSDRNAEILASFRERGTETTSDARDLAKADIIFLCLPSSEVVQQVVLGERGLIGDLKKGQTVVDLSTITYKTTVEIAKALHDAGVGFVDAPISGMEARAADATLTVMCGGEQATFDAVEPFLSCIGNKILYMGPAGSGQLTKLINQLLFNINAAALAEILPMAVKMGLNPEKVGDVVNSGTGKSYASEFFIPRVLEGGFSAGYPMKNAYKDLVSGAEISASLCIPLPVLAAATSTYQMALLKGQGDRDKGAMVAVFEDLLGVKFRKQSA